MSAPAAARLDRPPRVLLVDGDGPLSDGLISSGCEVLVADRPSDVVAVVDRAVPDLVLVGARERGAEPSGVALARAVRTSDPGLPVAVYAEGDARSGAISAWGAGIPGYLTAPWVRDRGDDLGAVIRMALAGAWHYLVDPHDATEGPLSQRQRELVALAAAGQTRHQIATALGISERTVDAHLARSKHRMGLRTVTALKASAGRTAADRPDPPRPGRNGASGEASATRVLLVEDDEYHAYTVAAILSAARVETVEVEPDEASVLAALDDQPFDLVMLDLHLGPGRPDGIALARAVREAQQDLPVAICTVRTAPGDAARAWDAGIPAFVTKRWLLRNRSDAGAVLRLIAGGALLYFVEPRPEPERRPLTERQRQVLRMKLANKIHREIALSLFISPRAVDSHLADIKHRLGVTAMDDLRKVAVEQGLH